MVSKVSMKAEFIHHIFTSFHYVDLNFVLPCPRIVQHPTADGKRSISKIPMTFWEYD